MASPEPVIGRTLGRYRLVEKIGAGGMGFVFRAHDERLRRDVALKVLAPGTLHDEEARRRFRNEALALSSLNHPNIAVVHDFDSQDGRDFLVTELIPGVSLDDKLLGGPLPESEALRLAAQIADGLAAAHQRGIVHRDLKPGNLRVTSEGRLKILDFGLAQLQAPADELTRSVTAEPATTSGTLPYMAPEQLRGEAPDPRSDIWAAGAVLYEMVTGRRPFERRTASALAGEILHQPVVPPRRLQPELSPRLEEVILKCLEKSAEDRYQSTRELLVDLRRCAAPSSVATVAPVRARRFPAWGIALFVVMVVMAAMAAYFYLRPKPIRSVAVLPFVNASGDAGREFLSDGITEELINRLTQVPGLRVIARPTAFTYKGRQVAPGTIGRELNVGALVFGRLTQVGDRVAVQVDVVDASDGSEIWGGQFQRPAAEVHSIQQDIAVQVAGKLQLKLSGEQEQRLASGPATNSEAYQNYLRGRFCISQVAIQKLPQCLEMFQQAVSHDPRFGPAWAGLADAYAYRGMFEVTPPAQAAAQAREAASKALQLDDTLSEAHTSLGIIKLVFDWDFPAAEKELRRAVELNPGNVYGRHWYAHYLEVVGRLDEAHAEMRKVADLDPLSDMYTDDLAAEYRIMRQPQKVIEMSQRWTTPTGADLRWVMLALAYQEAGKRKESAELAESILRENPSVMAMGLAAQLLGNLGRRDRAALVLAELKRRSARDYIPPFEIALAAFGTGDEAQGFEYLKLALDEHSPQIVFWMLLDPLFDFYRSDPRLVELERRYHLPAKAGQPAL